MAASTALPQFISTEKTVAAAGTAEALVTESSSGDTWYRAVAIIAKVGNTGQVYIGGSDVASATNDGLDAGDTLALAPPGGLHLKDIFVDADTTGEGVDIYGMS